MKRTRVSLPHKAGRSRAKERATPGYQNPLKGGHRAQNDSTNATGRAAHTYVRRQSRVFRQASNFQLPKCMAPEMEANGAFGSIIHVRVEFVLRFR